MCDTIENVEPRLAGAQDRANPNFMGLASVGLEIGVFSDLLYSVLIVNTILGLYFLRSRDIQDVRDILLR
jgi:hypothetical protein